MRRPIAGRARGLARLVLLATFAPLAGSGCDRAPTLPSRVVEPGWDLIGPGPHRPLARDRPVTILVRVSSVHLIDARLSAAVVSREADGAESFAPLPVRAFSSRAPGDVVPLPFSLGLDIRRLEAPPATDGRAVELRVYLDAPGVSDLVATWTIAG